MASSSLHKASDLPPDIRQAVEALLGRPLAQDERVSVTAYPPHQAPRGEVRAALARRLEERINRTAQKLNDVPDDELDALIDEAVDRARHQRS